MITPRGDKADRLTLVVVSEGYKLGLILTCKASDTTYLLRLCLIEIKRFCKGFLLSVLSDTLYDLFA